jgi:hypothetical protein
MGRMLAMVLSSKGSIQAEMVAFNSEINSLENSFSKIEMLSLRRDIQVANKKQVESSPFEGRIGDAAEMRIFVKACSLGLKKYHSTEQDELLSIEPISDDAETGQEIEEYSIVVF